MSLFFACCRKIGSLLLQLHLFPTQQICTGTYCYIQKNIAAAAAAAAAYSSQQIPELTVGGTGTASTNNCSKYLLVP